MEHQQIFATNIFLIDEFIPQSVKAEIKVIDDMKKYNTIDLRMSHKIIVE